MFMAEIDRHEVVVMLAEGFVEESEDFDDLCMKNLGTDTGMDGRMCVVR
jgi:hypothetical protein